MSVGELLRAWREREGLTQAQAAVRFGVTHKQVNRWENGHAEPGKDHLATVARLLGVPLEDLLPGASPPEA